MGREYTIRELINADLGGTIVANFNLKAAINTQYESAATDIQGVEHISLSLTVTETGTSVAGVGKIYAIPCLRDETELTNDIDLVTAIDLTASSTVIVTMAKGLLATMRSSLAGAALSATAPFNAAILLGFPKVKFGVQITTADTGTGNTIVGALRAIIQTRK